MMLFFGVIDFILIIASVIIYLSIDPIKEANSRRRARNWQRKWDAGVTEIRAETIRQLEADGVTYGIDKYGRLANPGQAIRYSAAELKHALFWADVREEEAAEELLERLSGSRYSHPEHTEADFRCCSPIPALRRDSSKMRWKSNDGRMVK